MLNLKKSWMRKYKLMTFLNPPFLKRHLMILIAPLQFSVITSGKILITHQGQPKSLLLLLQQKSSQDLMGRPSVMNLLKEQLHHLMILPPPPSKFLKLRKILKLGKFLNLRKKVKMEKMLLHLTPKLLLLWSTQKQQ